MTKLIKLSVFYFETAGRQVFGCLETPDSDPVGAVLICPPVGHEYGTSCIIVLTMLPRAGGRR